MEEPIELFLPESVQTKIASLSREALAELIGSLALSMAGEDYKCDLISNVTLLQDFFGPMPIFLKQLWTGHLVAMLSEKYSPTKHDHLAIRGFHNALQIIA